MKAHPSSVSSNRTMRRSSYGRIRRIRPFPTNEAMYRLTEAGSRCIAPTNLSVVIAWFLEQYMRMAVSTGAISKEASTSLDSLVNMAVTPAARYPKLGSISSSRSMVSVMTGFTNCIRE